MNQKVKGFDKFLLVLLMLIVILVGAAFVCMAIGVITAKMLEFAVGLSYYSVVSRLVTGAIGVVLLILAFRILIAFNRKETERKDASILVKLGEYGSTYITIAALDSMVQKHCRANPKVKECISRIIPLQDQINIKLRLTVLADTCIPELTGELQSTLKTYVETLSGITVSGIDITILSQPAQKQA